jgi:hypothetical protein
MKDWRYWWAQGFTFWAAGGPSSGARPPDPCALASLVQESLRQPRPR